MKKSFTLVATVLGCALFVGLGACGSETPGVVVGISAVHHMSPDMMGMVPENGADVPRVFTTDLDYEITLDKGYITVLSAKLTEPHTMTRIWKNLFRLVSPVKLAYAHSESSPTVIGVPHVIRILDEDLLPLELGHLNPRAGTYDHVHLTIGPADDDAEGLPSDVTGGYEGFTLYLSGSYVPSGGGPAVPFEVTSTAEEHATVHLHDPLVLSYDGQYEDVLIGTKYDTWFDGIDLATASGPEIAAGMLANLVASMHEHTGAVHAH